MCNAVKLIASDMDGTLLNDEKQFPPDFDCVLYELEKRNIHFAVASGRSFSTLEINFKDKPHNIDFICDNGAYVVIGGEVVKISIIDERKIKSLLEVCDGLDGVIPVLCGVKGIYFENRGGVMSDEVKKFYLKFNCVENIHNVNDDIFKVAIYDPIDAESRVFPVVSRRFENDFSLAVTGIHWMDLMNSGINKGGALEVIQRRLGITRAETMTFGDYFNDKELLLASDYSFVMANAHKGMFEFANYTAKSNNEFGVTEAIKKYVLNNKIC